ncbi:hypothetical protein OESDEN_13896 [Oesophagostomum dentatum]|uniref:HAD hydrolase, family IIA n=1 Tax=Oesophagostomum dentatum TaxID=61180 RepID=A0A0B1SM04_OESDE|nr:hypothetical protein OESDEN_13896 [Oesophagostomum dentatum]
MSQSSGGGIFKGALRHAFRQECNLYNRRKSLPLSGKASKMFSMTCNDANADELNAETFEELLPEFDCFIFGADGKLTKATRVILGLLWLRNGVITDAANLVNLLIEKKKEVFILTNDTTTSRDSHVKKLREHRFKSKLSKERIVTPALLAANYIETNKVINGKGVYLMASGGIQQDLEESGITFFGHGPDPLPDEKSGDNELFGIDLPPQPGEVCAVLVGQDKYFNFKKLMKAANFLKNPKCLFLATSDNSVILDENRDVVIPDAGVLLDY